MDDIEDQASLKSSRAPNAIYNGVDFNVFKLIYTCSSTKEVWKIFKVAYEGTSKVKTSRLQIMSSKFKSLKMMEEETIAKFNVRVLDIANESYNLGERIFESKLIRKVLISLPRKFNMKVFHN